MKPTSYKEKFGCLSQAKRVWAVASIHGDAGRLIALHDDLVRQWKHGDRLVYLGNYLGRGKGILDVLDELLSFRINRLCLAGMVAQDVIFLRGAQEEMWRKLLQIQLARDPNTVFDWMVGHGIEETLRAYGEDVDEVRKYFREGILSTTKWANRLQGKIHEHPGHNDIFVSLRRAAYTENGELLFVHAGIDPSLPIIEQTDTFWWANSQFDKIDKPYAGFNRLIRGYDNDHSGLVTTPYTVTLDGGCGFGGPLRAACFTLDGEIDDEIIID